MSEWQDMGSAPRVGVFLVFLEKELTGSRIHTMKRALNRHGQVIATIGSIFHFDAPRPTHWQPLPQPPKETRG